MSRTFFPSLTALCLFLFLSVPSYGINVLWVTENSDGSNPPSPDDVGWTQLLEANGHMVIRRNVTQMTVAQQAIANASDLVIVSRDTNSGNYDDGNEIDLWNGISSPLMQQSQFLVRNSRWDWLNTGGNPGTGDGIIQADDPGHPIFAGVPLGGGNQVDIANSSTPASNINNAGNGQLLASDPDNGNVTIALWAAGQEFFPGAGQTAGGTRMFFGAGNDGNNPKGGNTSTAAGEQLFLNAVNFLAPEAGETQILSEWQFEGNAAATNLADGITGSAVTPGNLSFEFRGDLGYPTGEVLRIFPNNNNNLDEAVANDGFLEFSVDADEKMNLESLVFDAARGGGGTPRGWGLSSSADGFASIIDTADIPTVRSTLTGFVIDLSDDMFQGVSDITFRLYQFSPGNGSTIEIDSLAVIGSVQGVPEPTTGVLALLGLSAMGLRRRRTAA